MLDVFFFYKFVGWEGGDLVGGGGRVVGFVGFLWGRGRRGFVFFCVL